MATEKVWRRTPRKFSWARPSSGYHLFYSHSWARIQSYGYRFARDTGKYSLTLWVQEQKEEVDFVQQMSLSTLKLIHPEVLKCSCTLRLKSTVTESSCGWSICPAGWKTVLPHLFLWSWMLFVWSLIKIKIINLVVFLKKFLYWKKILRKIWAMQELWNTSSGQ